MLLIFLLFMAAPVHAEVTLVLRLPDLPTARRLALAYQIGGVLPWDLARGSGDWTTLSLDCVRLGSERCAELGALVGSTGTLDPERTRALWSKSYLATRAERGDTEELPDTLASFRSVHSFESWPSELVDPSAAKRVPRRIYRGSSRDGRTLSVAETLNPDQTVRETEVAIAAKSGSGDYHFYVYNAAGHLASESQFPSGIRSAPAVCLMCHIDVQSGRVARFLPE